MVVVHLVRSTWSRTSMEESDSGVLMAVLVWGSMLAVAPRSPTITARRVWCTSTDFAAITRRLESVERTCDAGAGSLTRIPAYRRSAAGRIRPCAGQKCR